ncbi:hypothetical protein RIVM261_066810 [Rivularia sp. IAM M-261]|nr:hypothetical protein RIVM261_066810 [Rivularia sp. IAM M-261]
MNETGNALSDEQYFVRYMDVISIALAKNIRYMLILLDNFSSAVYPEKKP